MSAASRTITVAGQPVRLYEAPERGFAFPWVEFNDLLQAVDFCPQSAADWAWRWLSIYPERSHTMPDGRLLVPSEVALGLLELARQGGWDPAERALQDYTDGSGRYFMELYSNCRDASFVAAIEEAKLRSAVCGVAH